MSAISHLHGLYMVFITRSFLPFGGRQDAFILQINDWGHFTFWGWNDSQCLEHGYRAVAELKN